MIEQLQAFKRYDMLRSLSRLCWMDSQGNNSLLKMASLISALKIKTIRDSRMPNLKSKHNIYQALLTSTLRDMAGILVCILAQRLQPTSILWNTAGVGQHSSGIRFLLNKGIVSSRRPRHRIPDVGNL